jgi:hypothetical protein
MSDWSPISAEELLELLKGQEKELDDTQREIFKKYRIKPYRAPIERYRKTEYFFVVAKWDNKAMYYEDVEEGFNVSPIDESGRILQHWCNDDDLKYAVHRLPKK